MVINNYKKSSRHVTSISVSAPWHVCYILKQILFGSRFMNRDRPVKLKVYYKQGWDENTRTPQDHRTKNSM